MRHRFLTASLLLTLAARPAAAQDVLDRIVGSHPNAPRVEVSGLNTGSVGALAVATGVPIGLERRDESNLPFGRERVLVRGRTLRDALRVMMEIDPGHEWREMNGVIVFRTSSAWRDPHSPLFALVAELRFDDASAWEVIDAVRRAMGAPSNPWTRFNDTRRVSLMRHPGRRWIC